MSNSSSSSSGGIGFCGLLCIAFVVLKLTGYIAWSWWWITSPVWIPIVLVILGFGIYMLILWIKSRKKQVKQEQIFPPNSTKESKFQQRLNDLYEERKRRL